MSITMELCLNDETNERLASLASLAGVTGCSKVYLVTQAIRLFLDKNEWQVQEIKQAVDAADNASADQFVDNEMVIAWMESWGTDHETPSPIE